MAKPLLCSCLFSQRLYRISVRTKFIGFLHFHNRLASEQKQKNVRLLRHLIRKWSAPGLPASPQEQRNQADHCRQIQRCLFQKKNVQSAGLDEVQGTYISIDHPDLTFSIYVDLKQTLTTF